MESYIFKGEKSHFLEYVHKLRAICLMDGLSLVFCERVSTSQNDHAI